MAKDAEVGYGTLHGCIHSILDNMLIVTALSGHVDGTYCLVLGPDTEGVKYAEKLGGLACTTIVEGLRSHCARGCARTD